MPQEVDFHIPNLPVSTIEIEHLVHLAAWRAIRPDFFLNQSVTLCPASLYGLGKVDNRGLVKLSAGIAQADAI